MPERPERGPPDRGSVVAAGDLRAGRAEPRPNGLVGQHRDESVENRRRRTGVDQQRSVPADLGQRGEGGGQHRRAVCHRLERGQAEALEQREVRQGAGPRQQPAADIIADPAEEVDPVAAARRDVFLVAAPPATPGDDQPVLPQRRNAPAGGQEGPDQQRHVLPRMQVAHIEQVRAAHPALGEPSIGLLRRWDSQFGGCRHGVGDHVDSFRGQAEGGEQVGPRVRAGHQDDARLAQMPRYERPQAGRGRPGVVLRSVPERQVADGDRERHPAGERRMGHSHRQVRLHPAQRPRQAGREVPGPRPRRQPDDGEAGVARDLRRHGSRAEQQRELLVRLAAVREPGEDAAKEGLVAAPSRTQEGGVDRRPHRHRSTPSGAKVSRTGSAARPKSSRA